MTLCYTLLLHTRLDRALAPITLLLHTMALCYYQTFILYILDYCCTVLQLLLYYIILYYVILYSIIHPIIHPTLYHYVITLVPLRYYILDQTAKATAIVHPTDRLFDILRYTISTITLLHPRLDREGSTVGKGGCSGNRVQ